MILGREPVAVLAAINALVALGVGFGLDLSSEQQGLIAAAVSAVIAVIARQAVTPNVTAEEHIDTAVHLTKIGVALPPPDTEKTTGAP